nr:MAG TPA: hypothetical protein [Caudoviricetes sp.]
MFRPKHTKENDERLKSSDGGLRCSDGDRFFHGFCEMVMQTVMHKKEGADNQLLLPN